MPPKKKLSVPASRVYKSSTPLQQSRFPLTRKTIRYGKQTTKKISKQETLTQIGYVELQPELYEDEDDSEIYQEQEKTDHERGQTTERPDEEVDCDINNEEKPPKMRRNTSGDTLFPNSLSGEELGGIGDHRDHGKLEKPRKKRRKTSGDEPCSNLKDEDQTTITQFDWILRGEQETEDSIYAVPSSSPQSRILHRRTGTGKVKPPQPSIRRSSRRTNTSAPSAICNTMPPPRTPRRRLPQEIPSSESPSTPSSRTSSIKRSMLKERSINLPIPFNAKSKPPSSIATLPKLIVEDTFASDDIGQQTPLSTSPSEKSTPAKIVRFASMETSQYVKAPPINSRIQETRSTGLKKPVKLANEILDSDAESDGGYDEQVQSSNEDLEEETLYGDIGVETQKLLGTQKRSSTPFTEANQLLGKDVPDGLVGLQDRFMESQILGEDTSEELLEEETQYIESQRLETQHMRSLAPRTIFSDAFISIRPQNVSKIVSRTKDHDFRRQKIPETVSRVWIYETSPVQILKYMAVISGAKRPGEIEDENGAGNAEFNAKAPDCGEIAYEILELYELADPLPWATIALNEWLPSPPRKPILVKPAILDQLMANLKPPLFWQARPESPVSPSTDTQEAEEQLLNTMIQYTQQPTETFPSHIIKEEDEEVHHKDGEDDEDNDKGDEIEEDEQPPHSRPANSSRRSTTPSKTFLNLSNQSEQDDDESSYHTLQKSSQGTILLPKEHRTPSTSQQPPGPLVLSQAETVDLTQITQFQTPRHHSIADIIFESPSRPISTVSSALLKLPTPQAREFIGPESLMPYSMSSSQLLTKSQMLPESLLNSTSRPPLVIQDSEDEDDDDDDDDDDNDA